MTRARLVGMLFQSLILGTLLFIAVCQLFAAHSGARIFRYQAF